MFCLRSAYTVSHESSNISWVIPPDCTCNLSFLFHNPPSRLTSCVFGRGVISMFIVFLSFTFNPSISIVNCGKVNQCHGPGTILLVKTKHDQISSLRVQLQVMLHLSIDCFKWKSYVGQIVHIIRELNLPCKASLLSPWHRWMWICPHLYITKNYKWHLHNIYLQQFQMILIYYIFVHYYYSFNTFCPIWHLFDMFV